MRLQHSEELAQSAVQGEISQLQGSVAGQVSRLQGGVQQAQATVAQLGQQLQDERQQRAADAAAFQARLAHAQRQAEEQITCGAAATCCPAHADIRAPCSQGH